MPNILIAGGGSGGHVAPAIAAAEALHSLKCNSILAHSNRAVDSLMTDEIPFNSITVPAYPLSLKPIEFIKFCFGFIRSERRVCDFIKKNNVDCVLATGGFVAAPALRAAKKSKCATVLLNLDNPPGKANRLATRWADTVLSTVDCTLQNITRIQPPLRQSVIAPSDSSECYEQFGLDPNRMTLLVTGASQGASTINELVPLLAKHLPNHFHGWQVLHIAGSKHVKTVEKYWELTKIPYRVVDYVQNMGLAWGITDLAVTRGGANTIAELAINAIPAVVLPYPYHQDEHQRTNAEPLEEIGGIIIEKDYINTVQNISNAGETILSLLKDHQKRFEMRGALISLKPVNGAYEVGQACIHSINV